MRSSSTGSGRSDDREWPIFEIGPLLIAYGGEPCMEDTGWRAYKCPFHNERTPSASVNTQLNVFVCHSCGVKGNAVQCVMKHEGLKYGDALKRTVEACGGASKAMPSTTGKSTRLSRAAGSRAFKRTWRK